MIKKSFYIIGISALLAGCSNDMLQPEMESDLVPITLSTPSVVMSTDTEVQTRAGATTDFPNSGSIAVVAAKTTSGAAQTDWSSSDNFHLNHVAATVGVKSNNQYPVTFSPVQYWPFDSDTYLSFAAYSPSNTTQKSGEPHTLTVTASTNVPFPDLLYSTPTTTAYNKESGKSGVELTQFKHAMARLVIKVVPIDKSGNEITDYNSDNFKITKLGIQTKVTTGNFDFINPAWTLTAPGTSASHTSVYSLISANNYTNNNAKKLPYDSSDSKKGGSNKEYYLLPATDDVNTVELSKIDFELRDKSYTYSYATGNDGSLDEFKDASNSSVKLEMGKTTVLTIKVKVVNIQTGGDDAIILYGTLKDWEYKGNSTVTIN
nr:hypothetical protein [uncultured Bacteroides sp.]